MTYSQLYYQKNKERIKANVAAYKKANPDKVRQWVKEHDARRPELRKASQARNHKRHYHKRKERIRTNALKTLYGLTPEQFDQMVADQNGVCEICGQPPAERKVRGGGIATRLCVDHNHNTGEVRKLLCAECNLIVGHVENKIHLIPKILDYLKEHEV